MMIVRTQSEETRTAQQEPQRDNAGTIPYVVFCLLFALLELTTFAMPAMSQAPEPIASQAVMGRTLMAVFSDHPMRDAQWQTLSTAIHAELAAGLAETRPLKTNQLLLVRGDAMQPGLEGEDTIAVFLHGACDVLPQSKLVQSNGPLGWVSEDHGVVRPFVQVNCTRIAQVLDARALGMNQDERQTAMARAIARVILHEWLHIALQSASHASHGIGKAQLSVNDLVEVSPNPSAVKGHGR